MKRRVSRFAGTITTRSGRPIPSLHCWQHLDRKSTRLNSSHITISYAGFCLNAAATSEIFALSLHDALPISADGGTLLAKKLGLTPALIIGDIDSSPGGLVAEYEAAGVEVRRYDHNTKWETDTELALLAALRSEEHTSELQSHHDLVCRLLLERSSDLRDLRSFPTRRSSDLCGRGHAAG